MSMDKSAIETIQQSATGLITGQSDKLPDNVVIVPENHSVQSLEKFEDQPDRFRAHFKTTMLQAFVTYCIDHVGAESEVFVNDQDITANAIFDLGDGDDPHWAEHRATLAPTKLPGYEAVLHNNEQHMSQLGLVDFAEDWSDQIVFIDSDLKEIEFADALNRIRRVTVNNKSSTDSNQGDFKSSRSAMDEIEIKSGNNPPPARMMITAIPYDGFEVRQITCQIRAVTAGEKVAMKYRIIGLQQLKNAIAEEFKDRLVDALENVTVRIGDLTTNYR